MPDDAPSHDVAKARIPVEFDTASADAFMARFDTWLDAKAEQIKHLFDGVADTTSVPRGTADEPETTATKTKPDDFHEAPVPDLARALGESSDPDTVMEKMRDKLDKQRLLEIAEQSVDLLRQIAEAVQKETDA